MAAPSVSGDRLGPLPVVPSDWPGDGDIDLCVHDLPHASSTTEWWYVNGHCTTIDGKRFSLFAAFFRQVKGYDPTTREPQYAHSLTWALQDVDAEASHNVSRVDHCAAEEGLKRIKRGLGSSDERLNRALREILERGNVPLPDRVFDSRVYVNLQRLELGFGGDLFEKLDDGRYRMRLYDPRRALGCDVVLDPQKPPTRHGRDGVVRGSHDEAMFYYFIPRNDLRGTITLHGRKCEIAAGQAWYDHEFGVGEVEEVDDDAEERLPPAARDAARRERRKRHEAREVGWDWLSAQLDDGTDLSVYPLTYAYRGESAGNWSVMSDPSGNRSGHTDALFEHLEHWQSTQTFFHYPVRWRVVIPSADVFLDVRAAFKDQEFMTLISKPSFWEGRVEVEGTVRGRPVRGIGFVERSGFASFDDLDGFFEAVGKVVRKSVRDVIPLDPTYEDARDLIASKDSEQYMRGVDVQQYARSHLSPIREIVDRGGKGWRSYAAITCCDIVGGDSRQFVQWIAMPELMHVGSLIVDDVQDRSTTRRGGKTAHVIYGEAQAINSGTAAYFLIHRLLTPEQISDADKLKLYDLYFDAMRAGHAGQALDLDGFDDLMETAVATGDVEVLEERVLAVHRLKTAAPAGCLARMGAIAGGGTGEQIESLGRFFEDLGLAFQIIDDVLNIRGFRNNLKALAEDVRQGKVTLPVVKAMGRLPAQRRRFLHESLRSRPEDSVTVKEIVDILEGSGAVEACAVHARQLVEQGWQRLEPLVEDSMAKMLLRAFGWYLLERHY